VVQELECECECLAAFSEQSADLDHLISGSSLDSHSHSHSHSLRKDTGHAYPFLMQLILFCSQRYVCLPTRRGASAGARTTAIVENGGGNKSN
jgi:hypothetical protein